MNTTTELAPAVESQDKPFFTKGRIVGGAVVALAGTLVAIDMATHGAVRDTFNHVAAFLGFDSGSAAPTAPVSPGCEIICPQEGGPVMGSR